MKQVTLGFVPTRRNIFSAPAAVEYADLTRKRLEQLGVRVRLTPGEERNFKVTTPLDLQLARLLAAEENEHNKE